MTPSRALQRALSKLLAPFLVVAFLAIGAGSAHASAWVSFGQVAGDPGAGRSAATGLRFASDSAGNQVAVWVEQPSPFKVMVNFRPAGGSWGSPQTLDSLATAQPETDLAVDPAGNFMVVYSEPTTQRKVFSAYLQAGQSTFGAPQQF
jgi:hypothetical protein